MRGVFTSDFMQQRHKCAAMRAKNYQLKQLLVSYSASKNRTRYQRDTLHAIDATGTVYRATLYYTRVFTFCAQLSAARAA